MDDVKDMKKSDSLSRFLDSHVVRTNPFGRNASGEKSYRRAERLVAALHLVTSHVQDNEPVKRAIRDVGIRLFPDILALRDEMRISSSTKVHAVQSTIRELISLVRMLAISGRISTQNADIVVEAADELGNFLNVSQKTHLSENIVLSREDILGGALAAEKRTTTTVKDKDSSGGTRTDAVVSDKREDKDIRDTIKDTDVRLSAPDAVSVRGSEIIAVLRSSGEVGIRDVASNLPEYSEKMIQRELASLVAAGRVKKTGFKRWSRYSIASDA